MRRGTYFIIRILIGYVKYETDYEILFGTLQ